MAKQSRIAPPEVVTSKLVSDEKPRMRRIGSLVSQLMSRRGYAQVTANGEMQRSVVAVIGEQLGLACRVGNLRAGVLQIFVADSVSLQELNFRKRAIVRQLQQDLPDSQVTDVRFRIQT